MTENKRTSSATWGFRESDDAQVMACLTDDVEWDRSSRLVVIGGRLSARTAPAATTPSSYSRRRPPRS